MTLPPDLLRFRGATPEEYITGWTGPWPPPETLIIAVGFTTGTVSIFEDDDPELVARAKALATVTRMRRGNHSVLDERVKGPNLTRAAEYEVECEL